MRHIVTASSKVFGMRTTYLKTVYSGQYSENVSDDVMHPTSTQFSTQSSHVWKSCSESNDYFTAARSSLRRSNSNLARVMPFIVMDSDGNRYIYAWLESGQYETLAASSHTETFRSFVYNLNTSLLPVYECSVQEGGEHAN